ncbi:MAG: 16S rRNA (cytidine(1402)-2'-O)-methyltransferase [Patescibacteria group bacterium]|nr:16S rRNA (cytidine(1402)-2'-O)-methyltransferase [Patescibacteria group bacterium]
MKLYIIATPIGNLEDITLRALKILKSVDYILCEDTRHSLKLLRHYQIEKPLISYHQHSQLKKIDEIINLLKNGKNLALISDAGTPGISDPGNKLIKEVLKAIPEVEIIPIPGPSAMLSLASVSGMNTDKFIFLGFPPSKNKRKKFFEEIKNYSYPVIIYESPYRLIKTLEEIKSVMPLAKVVVGKELTKIYEKIYRGSMEQVIKEIKKDGMRGEYTIIIFNLDRKI